MPLAVSTIEDGDAPHVFSNLTLQAMIFRLPVRRFLQTTDNTEAPRNRVGTVQWVLARPMCRFNTFNLAQVPVKNRSQALALELAQWTPFAHSEYYIGWRGHLALVWGWDNDKVRSAVGARGINADRVQILPETVLQRPLPDGLCLTRCLEGYEGQQWGQAHLEHSRWWPQIPTPDEWLMFQRDASIAPAQQQAQPPAARAVSLQERPWLTQRTVSGGRALQLERLIVALAAMMLLLPTLWYGLNWYKVQTSNSQMQQQQTELQREAEPIAQARGQALDYLARITALRSLAPYPGQLELMAAVAQALPKDGSTLKSWDFQQRQLKFTVTSKADVATTLLIGAFQQAGFFRDVKGLPGADPKSVMFQMDVIGIAP